MPDYVYLLENRLSADQQNALRQLREAVREAGMILFLTGDAVRDLTSGHAVRELEVSVHGNALNLKKIAEKLGGNVWGESAAFHTLYLCFPGTVRVDVISTQRVEYPKPGKAVYQPASIQEDLRRRDFTVNAMAISLNEGSFGLLMDPLNGAADIEARTLRLVSNYGFLEEPSLLIRATRYMTRLGWGLDPKTRTRFENAKGEGVIEHLSDEARSRELEQIGHEEEGLKVLRALEDEGWMKFLFPAWTAAKADEEKLKTLHDLAVELLVQGVHVDVSAAQMQLLTAKLAPKDLAALKKLMLRPGFVEEWNSLDAMAAKFAKVLLSKENSTPSASFKLFTSYDPEAILWLEFTSKDPVVQERFNQFLKVWPEARQRIPHAVMQEMRITPELAAYREIVQAVFLELIDGRLSSAEEIRAFLEPHSPPAPPPQVSIKRPRVKRGAEAKLKERSYDDDEDTVDVLDEDEDLDDLGGDEDETELGMGLNLPKVDLEPEIADDLEPVEDELDVEELEPIPAAGKRASEAAAQTKLLTEAPGVKQVVPAPVAAKASKEEESVSASPDAAKTAAKPKVKSAEDSVKPPAKAPDHSVKPPQVEVQDLPVKPPQVEARDLPVKPPQVEAQDLSVKPPQVKAQALSVKPPQVKARTRSVKPPQVKARTRSVKPPQVKGRALSVKPSQGKAPVKALAVKAAGVKGKPAKAAKPAAKKPAPKPVKKR
ncbi:MAG TPA: CCA tRNA nucleotidyltransferase [Terracidiphilus sp.]